MFSHVILGVNNLDVSKKFYDAVLGALGVPTLDGLGADGDSAHTLHEHILVSTLEARLNFWRHLLTHLA